MAGIHHLVKQMTLLRNVVIFFSGLAVNNLQSEKAASKAALTVITFLTGHFFILMTFIFITVVIDCLTLDKDLEAMRTEFKVKKANIEPFF